MQRSQLEVLFARRRGRFVAGLEAWLDRTLRAAVVAGTLVVASSASANVALTLTQPALLGASPSPRALSWTPHVRLACARRCPSLRLAPRWLAALPQLALGVVAPATVSAGVTSLAGASQLPASGAAAPLSVGAHVALGGGRELNLQLTPTPGRCAPLFSLTY
jgi:hypothetical protein